MKLTLKFDNANGSWQTRAGGYLFCLSRKAHASDFDPSAEAEYMIVSRLGKHPMGFIVEPVDPERHVLVEHSGFMCSGSMCRTDAVVKNIHGAHRNTRQGITMINRTITPGRVTAIVRTVDNVNANWRFPIWDQEELRALERRADFKPENLNMKEVEPGSKAPIASYQHGWREQIPGMCYVEVGDSRACGLPGVEELA